MEPKTINGQLHCPIEQLGDMVLWEACEPQQLQQMSMIETPQVSASVAGVLVGIAVLSGLFTWGGSVAQHRRTHYEALLKTARRSL